MGGAGRASCHASWQDACAALVVEVHRRVGKNCRDRRRQLRRSAQKVRQTVPREPRCSLTLRSAFRWIVSFPKISSGRESHRRIESSHDRGRCSRSCIRSQCSLSISSSCRAGLKPRTCAADDGFVQRDGRGRVCILAREILQRFSRTRFNGPSVKNGRRPFRRTTALPQKAEVHPQSCVARVPQADLDRRCSTVQVAFDEGVDRPGQVRRWPVAATQGLAARVGTFDQKK